MPCLESNCPAVEMNFTSSFLHPLSPYLPWFRAKDRGWATGDSVLCTLKRGKDPVVLLNYQISGLCFHILIFFPLFFLFLSLFLLFCCIRKQPIRTCWWSCISTQPLTTPSPTSFPMRWPSATWWATWSGLRETLSVAR